MGCQLPKRWRVTDILSMSISWWSSGRFLHSFAELKPAYITVHYEAVTHLQRTLAQIRGTWGRRGPSANPHTPLTGLKFYPIRSGLDPNHDE